MAFSQLDEQELKTAADAIILKAAAISGCSTPETELFADVLTKEMVLYLNGFGFGNLTIEEIFLALRLNTKGELRYPSGLEIEKVHFSGSCFNIDYLSKVLSNYMAVRNNLDGVLRNKIDGY